MQMYFNDNSGISKLHLFDFMWMRNERIGHSDYSGTGLTIPVLLLIAIYSGGHDWLLSVKVRKCNRKVIFI